MAELSLSRLDQAITRLAASAGSAEHPGDTERLMTYWAEGPGAAKIMWDSPGDFDRCVLELGKYVNPDQVKGLCSNLHQRATGARPGYAPGDKA